MNDENRFKMKKWGYEYWIANSEKYCGKLLFFKAGMHCSWHYHEKKDETFYVQSGKVMIIFSRENDYKSADAKILEQGATMHIPVGLRHEIKGLVDSLIIEVSTQHFDEDSIRIIV